MFGRRVHCSSYGIRFDLLAAVQKSLAVTSFPFEASDRVNMPSRRAVAVAVALSAIRVGKELQCTGAPLRVALCAELANGASFEAPFRLLA